MMDKLHEEFEELGLIQREMEALVDVANENGEEIDEQVHEWLGEARKVSADVKTTWLINETAKSTCWWNRLFLCNSPSHKSDDDISRMITLVSNLVARGKSVICVCFHEHPRGIELVWRRGFVEFRSRSYAFNKILEGLKGEDSRIIGVCGMGGIGKTILVVELGKKVKDEKLFDHVLIVTVSQTPDIRNIQGTLADMLNLKFREVTETGRANELRAKLEKERKVLVILDDVWENFGFESIGIPSVLDNEGCKIILTTRRPNMCKDMACSLIVQLDAITEDESWALFCKYAGRLNASFSSVARKIVEECAGLPLAIVTVGSALRDKSLLHYKHAIQKLRKADFVDIESADRDIYACIKLSYDYLEDVMMQECFLLCSLFPEYSMIKVEGLTRKAYGLGLLGIVDSFDEARKEMLSLITKLENVCLLATVDASRGYVGQFIPCHTRLKMHDMVRDVALWITKVNGRPFFLPSSPKELQSKKCYQIAKAFFISMGPQWQFSNKLEYPDLKMLIVKRTHMMRQIDAKIFPDNFLEETRDLQVLELTLARDEAMLSLTALLDLHNLKSLQMSGNLNWRFKGYLSLVGKLKNLEILELQCTSGTVLPEWIGDLWNLRLLDLSKWRGLEDIPLNLLTRLIRLEEFYTPCSYDTRMSSDFLSDLMLLPHLSAFSGRFMGTSSLPGDLKFMNLQRYNVKTSNQVDSNYTWSKVLALDILNDLSMKVFEHLFPGVERLCIEGTMQGIKNLCPQVDVAGFQNLRELHLSQSESLECLVDATESNCMPKGPQQIRCFRELKYLTLRGCNRMTNLFNFRLAQNLFKLQHLDVSECEALETIFAQDGQDIEWMSPQSHTAVEILQELKSISIESCDKLKSIMPMSFLREGLSDFESMSVENCAEMGQVAESDGEENVVERGTVVMRNLQSLKLLNLPSLFNLLPLKWNLIVPSLSELVIANIGSTSQHVSDAHPEQGTHWNMFNGVLPARAFKSLLNFKFMQIDNCYDGEEVFDLEEVQLPVLTQLEVLKLIHLPCLKHIWKGMKEFVSLGSLIVIEIYNCTNITSLFTWSMARTLYSLQTLEIHCCRKLKNIIDHRIYEQVSEVYNLDISCFPKLMKLQVYKCHQLESIFPYSLAREFPCLEELEIKDCPKLENIFHDDLDRQRISMNFEEVKFQQLQELNLCRLPSLRSIAPENCHLYCPSLETVHLKYIAEQGESKPLRGQLFEESDKLLPFTRVIIASRPFLLKIKNSVAQVLFDLEENVIGPSERSLSWNLRQLILRCLPNLNSIWRGRVQLIDLRNLEDIQIHDCKALAKTLFTSAIAYGTLKSLKYLTVNNCMELENIFEPMYEKSLGSEGHSHRTFLPNLSRIEVVGCTTLVTLFPLSIAKHLPKLSYVHVRGSCNLENLFNEDREGYAEEDKDIMLPNLTKIQVRELPCLISIAPPGYVLSCQSLVELNGIKVIIENFRMEMIHDDRKKFVLENCHPVLHNLRTLCQFINLSQIFHLTVSDFLPLHKGLFARNMVHALSSLESIEIFNCHALEHLIEPANVDRSTSTISLRESNSSTTYFPRLKSVWIEGCGRLKTLFPTSIAQCLHELSFVHMKGLCQLEEIFFMDDDEKVESSGFNKFICLPKLSTLHLEQLPCLSRACPVGYT